MNPSPLLLSEALDTPMGAVAVLDDETRVVYANQAFDAFVEDTGPADDVRPTGSTYADVLEAVGFDTERIETELLAVVGGEQDVFRRECPLGNRWYLVKGSRFTHEGGTYVSTVVSEITVRKEMEAELRETVERLRYVTQMLSHDLKSPLNVAMAHVRMMARTDVPSPERVEKLGSALDRMARIVNDTVTIAKSDSASVDGFLSLGEAARRSWETSSTADATLTVVDDPAIAADPNLLSHILENLFTNAGVHGGEDVHVRVGSLADGFYVADDGDGFSESIKADLTEVFEQGFTTGTDGAGLGLAIVSYMADLHGWTIDAVESEAGGARFEVRGIELSDGTAGGGTSVSTD